MRDYTFLNVLANLIVKLQPRLELIDFILRNLVFGILSGRRGRRKEVEEGIGGLRFADETDAPRV